MFKWIGLVVTALAVVNVGRAQQMWTYHSETVVAATSANETWHGLAITSDGTKHHCWYQGLQTRRYSPGLYGPEVVPVTTLVRQDEPEIVAKGDKVFLALSDRSQTHSQQMMVLGYPWLADGTRPVMELVMSDNPDTVWLGRPFFYPAPNEDLVGVAFTLDWAENAGMSEYSFSPGPVRRDLYYAQGGWRQTYAAGAANSNGAYLVWRDMSLSGGGANGAVMGAMEQGTEMLLGPGYAGEPKVAADHDTDLLAVVWHRNQQAWCRILDPMGTPVAAEFQVNTSTAGWCRDVYPEWYEGSLYVLWERILSNRRSLEWVEVNDKSGSWAPVGPENPAHQGDDPYSIDQRDRGCHGLEFYGDDLFIPLVRWNGQNRDATLAHWKR